MAYERLAGNDVEPREVVVVNAESKMVFSEFKDLSGNKHYIHSLPYEVIDEPCKYEIRRHWMRDFPNLYVMRGDIEGKIKEIYNRVCLEKGCEMNYLPITIDKKGNFSCDDVKITYEEFLKKKNHTAKIKLYFRIYKEPNCLRLRSKIINMSIYSPQQPLACIPQHMLDMFQPEHRNCPICADTIEKDAYVTKCYHLFHMSCVSEWFKRNKTCPACRAEQ